jgi:hypothetical protein
MDDSMNDPSHESGEKVPYNAPRLVELGSIASLTQGVGGSAGDGQLGMTQLML